MVNMTKKKEPYPTVIRRTGKPPTKAQLKEMRDKVIALSRKKNGNKQSSDEDKPMTKKNDKKTEKKGKPASRKTLAPKDLVRMVEDWDDKTVSEWAKEFSVSYQTLLKMAQAINKEDKTLCPPKPKKATRADTAKATIALFKKKKGKK